MTCGFMLLCWEVAFHFFLGGAFLLSKKAYRKRSRLRRKVSVEIDGLITKISLET